MVQAPLRLNLGAGGLLLDGYVNCDIAPLPGIDVTCDLDRSPWPWEDASVTEIVASDIFEHIADPLVFMAECGRVLADGGMLKVRTTYWKARNAYTDPTHRRFCTENTFDYWVPGTEIGDRYGPAYGQAGAAFEKVLCGLDGQELVVHLKRIR